MTGDAALDEPPWRFAANLNSLADGEPLAVEVDGIAMALYRRGDEIYATSDRCTHGAARLSEGWLDGYEIECPLHQGRFDIRTGQCMAAPVTIDIRVFETRIQNGRIEVRRRRKASRKVEA